MVKFMKQLLLSNFDSSVKELISMHLQEFPLAPAYCPGLSGTILTWYDVKLSLICSTL